MWNRLIGKSEETSPYKVSRRKAHDSLTRRRPGSTTSASLSKPTSERGDDRADHERRRMKQQQEKSPSRDGARHHDSGSRSRHADVREKDKREERGKLSLRQGTAAGGAGGSRSADVQTDRGGDQAGDMARHASHLFNAQVGAPSFTQFPGQYNSLLPDLRLPKPLTNFSSHVSDQFPGQDPTQYSAPFRPPSAFAPSSGYGEAASYYGDQGQSVSTQPGVRSEEPSTIAGSQPQLVSSSLVSNTSQETGKTGKTPSSSGLASIAGSSHAANASGNNAYSVATVGTGKRGRPDTHNSAQPLSSPSRPGKQRSHFTPRLVAGSVPGPAVENYAAHHLSHQHTPSPGPNTNNHHKDQADAEGHHQEVMPMLAQRPQRRTLRTLIDWWKDYEDVQKMEEYTEFIGVCRGCFDPRTSVWDAPRKHLRKRRSSDSLQSGRSRVGTRGRYDNRVDKDRRYNSSDTDGRKKRKKDHRTSTGIAGYGLAQIGQTLWGQNNPSQETSTGRDASQPRGKAGWTGQVIVPANRQSQKAKIRGDTRDGGAYGRALHDDPHIESSNHGGRLVRSQRRSQSRRRNSGLVGPSSGVTKGVSVAGPPARHGTRSHSRSPGSRDANPTLRYNNGLFAGWFPSSTGKRQSNSSGKKKEFFYFGNSSSSSSDGLAYGAETGLRPRRNSRKADMRGNGDVNAAILGLGAAAAALSASRSRNRNQGRRAADLFIVKEPRSRRESRRSRKKDQMPSSDDSEDDWESASDNENSSVSSGLAYGDLDYKGNGLPRKSTESLLSESSGTSKWEWRWGSTKKRKKASVPEMRTPMEGTSTPAATDDGGQLLNTSPSARHGKATSDRNLLILEHIDPMPIPDTQNERTLNQISRPNSVLPTQPTPVPLQQPQPIAPMSTTIYTTQALPQATYVSPAGPPVFARAPPTWDAAAPQRPTEYTSSAIPSQLPPHQSEQAYDRTSRIGTAPRRGYSSPAISSFTKDLATVDFGTEPPGGVIFDPLAHSELVSPSVRFDLTKDQVAKEKRDGERYRVGTENANEKREEVEETERQNRERRERRRVEGRERERTVEQAAYRHAQGPTQEAEQSERELQRERPQPDRSQLNRYPPHDTEKAVQAGDYVSAQPDKSSQQSQAQRPQEGNQEHILFAAREYRKGNEHSGKIAELARMTASEIVEDLRGRYNEASPSMAAFFAPSELSSDAKQQSQYHNGPNGDYDLPMYTGPGVTDDAVRHSYSHGAKADGSANYPTSSAVPHLTLQAPTPPPHATSAPKAVRSRSSSPLGRSSDPKRPERNQSVSLDAVSSRVPDVEFTQRSHSDEQPDGPRGTNELEVQSGDMPVNSLSAAILESTHMPGGFEDDVEKVLREPDDDLPSGPQQQGFYQSPYYETVSDLGSGLDVPATKPTPPDTELPRAETDESMSSVEKEKSAQDDELPAKLTNKERKKRDKAAKRRTTDEDLVDEPCVPKVAKTGDSQTIQADNARAVEPTTSKKAEKQKDKTSKQKASRKDQAIVPQHNSSLDGVRADATAVSASSAVSESFVASDEDDKSHLCEDSSDLLVTAGQEPRIAVPGAFVSAELGPKGDWEYSERSGEPTESVPMKADNDPQDLWEAKQPRKKSKRRSGRYSSPLPGSPLKSEIAYDGYTDPIEGPMDRQSLERESEGSTMGVRNEADDVRIGSVENTETAIRAVGQDHLRSREGAAQGTLPVGNVPNVQAASESFDAPILSTTPTERPETFSDSHDVKRELEGDNEGSGAAASTLSVQSNRESGASGKSKKGKAGRTRRARGFSSDRLSDSISDNRTLNDVDAMNVGQGEGVSSQQAKHRSPYGPSNGLPSSSSQYAGEQSEASFPSPREDFDEDRVDSTQKARKPRGKDPDSHTHTTISPDESGDDAATRKRTDSFLGKGAEEDFPPLPECNPSSPIRQPAKTGPNAEVIPISLPMHPAFRPVDALRGISKTVRPRATAGPSVPPASSHNEDALVREQTPLPVWSSVLLQEAADPLNLPPLPPSRPTSPLNVQRTVDTQMPIEVETIAALPVLTPTRATSPVSAGRAEHLPPLPDTRPSPPLDVGSACGLPLLPAARPSSPRQVGLVVDLPSLPTTRPSTPVELGRAVDLPSLPATRPSSPIDVGQAVDLPPLPATRPSSPIGAGSSIDLPSHPITRPSSPIPVGWAIDLPALPETSPSSPIGVDRAIDLPSLPATRPSSPIDGGRAVDLPPLPETTPTSPIEVDRAIDVPTLPATRSTTPVEVGSAIDLPPLPDTDDFSPVDVDHGIDLLSSPITNPISPMELGSASNTPPLPATSPPSPIQADQEIDSVTLLPTPPSGIRLGMTDDRSLLESSQASLPTGTERATGPCSLGSENLRNSSFHPPSVPSSQFYTHAEPFIPPLTPPAAKSGSLVSSSATSSHEVTGIKDSANESETVRVAGAEDPPEPSSSAVRDHGDSYFSSLRSNTADVEAEQRQALPSAQGFTRNVTSIPSYGPGSPYTLEELVPTLPAREHSPTFARPPRSRGISTTAIPLRFRLPPSPGAVRDLPASSPLAGPPTSPLSMPRTRHSRPNSTEFKSNEFRPLYLLERNRKAPEVEEILPSLPSSKTASRSSSVEASDEEYQSALESPNPEADRDYNEWVVSGGEADLLDSQQPTPRAAAVSEKCLPVLQDDLPLDHVDELLGDTPFKSRNKRPAVVERFYTASDLAPIDRPRAQSNVVKDTPQRQDDQGQLIPASGPVQISAISKLHEALGTAVLGSAAVAIVKDVNPPSTHQSSTGVSKTGADKTCQSESDGTGRYVENLAKTESVAAHDEGSAAKAVVGNDFDPVDSPYDDIQSTPATEVDRQIQDAEDGADGWFGPLVSFGSRKGKKNRKGKGTATHSSSVSDSVYKPKAPVDVALQDKHKTAPVFPVTPVTQFPGMVAEIPDVFVQHQLAKSVDCQDTQNDLATERPAIQSFATAAETPASPITPEDSLREVVDSSFTEANEGWPASLEGGKKGRGRKGKKGKGKASDSSAGTKAMQESTVAGEGDDVVGLGPLEQLPLEPPANAYSVASHGHAEMPQGRRTSPAGSVDAQQREHQPVLDGQKSKGKKDKKHKTKSSLFNSGDEPEKLQTSSPTTVIRLTQPRDLDSEAHKEADREAHKQSSSWAGQKLLPSLQFFGDTKPFLPGHNVYGEGASPNALFRDTGEARQRLSKEQLRAGPAVQFFADTTPYAMNSGVLAYHPSPEVGNREIHENFLPSVSAENLSMGHEGAKPEPAEAERKVLEPEAHLPVLAEKAAEETEVASNNTAVPLSEPILEAVRGSGPMAQPAEAPSTVSRSDVKTFFAPNWLLSVIDKAAEAVGFREDANADISEPDVKAASDWHVADEAAATVRRTADDEGTDSLAVDESSGRKPEFGSSPVAAPVRTETGLTTSRTAKRKGKKMQTVDIWAEQEPGSTSLGTEAPQHVPQGRNEHTKEPNIGTSTEDVTEQSGAMRRGKAVKPKKRDKRNETQAGLGIDDAISPSEELEATLNSITFGGKPETPAKKKKGAKVNKARERDWEPCGAITPVTCDVQEEAFDEIAKDVPLPSDEESLPDFVENTTQEQLMRVAESKATNENKEAPKSGNPSSSTLTLAEAGRLMEERNSEQDEDEFAKAFQGTLNVEPELLPLPSGRDNELTDANAHYPGMMPLPEDESHRSFSGDLDFEPALIPLPAGNDDGLTEANRPYPELIPLPEDEYPTFSSGDDDVKPELIPLPGGNDNELMDTTVPDAEMIALPEPLADEAENLRDDDVADANDSYPELIPLPEAGPDEVDNPRDDDGTDANGPYSTMISLPEARPDEVSCLRDDAQTDANGPYPEMILLPEAGPCEVDTPRYDTLTDAKDPWAQPGTSAERNPRVPAFSVDTSEGRKDKKSRTLSDHFALAGMPVKETLTAPTLLQRNTFAQADDWAASSSKKKSKKPKKGISLKESQTQALEELAIEQEEIANHGSITPSEQPRRLQIRAPSLDEQQVQSSEPLKETVNESAKSAQSIFDHSIENQPRAEEWAMSSKKKNKRDKKGSKAKQTMPWDDDLQATGNAASVVTPRTDLDASLTPEDLDRREVLSRAQTADVLAETLEQQPVLDEAEAVSATFRQKKGKKGKKVKEPWMVNDEPERILSASPHPGTKLRFEKSSVHIKEALPEDFPYTEEPRAVVSGDIDDPAVVIASEETKSGESAEQVVDENPETCWGSSTKKKAKKRNKPKLEVASIPTVSPPKSEESRFQRVGAGPESMAVNILDSQPEEAALPESESMSRGANYEGSLLDREEPTVMESTKDYINQPSPIIDPANIPLPTDDDTLDHDPDDKPATGEAFSSITSREGLIQPADIPLHVEEDALVLEEFSDKPGKEETPLSTTSQDTIIQPADIPLPMEDDETELEDFSDHPVKWETPSSVTSQDNIIQPADIPLTSEDDEADLEGPNDRPLEGETPSTITSQDTSVQPADIAIPAEDDETDLERSNDRPLKGEAPSAISSQEGKIVGTDAAPASQPKTSSELSDRHGQESSAPQQSPKPAILKHGLEIVVMTPSEKHTIPPNDEGTSDVDEPAHNGSEDDGDIYKSRTNRSEGDNKTPSTAEYNNGNSMYTSERAHEEGTVGEATFSVMSDKAVDLGDSRAEEPVIGTLTRSIEDVDAASTTKPRMESASQGNLRTNKKDKRKEKKAKTAVFPSPAEQRPLQQDEDLSTSRDRKEIGAQKGPDSWPSAGKRSKKDRKKKKGYGFSGLEPENDEAITLSRLDTTEAAGPSEEVEGNPEEIGTELQTSGADLDFAATVAACLTASGFDANGVLDDAMFSHRASPASSALDVSDVDSYTAKRAARMRRSDKKKPISGTGSQHESTSQIRLDPEEIETVKALGNQEDFVATVAAGLQNTGFDPDIVLEDPAFHERESPTIAQNHEPGPSAAFARPRRHKAQTGYESPPDVARDPVYIDDPVSGPQSYKEREITKMPEPLAKKRASALDEEQDVVMEPGTQTKENLVDKGDSSPFIGRIKNRKGNIVVTLAAKYFEAVEGSTEPAERLEDLQACEIALPPTPAEEVTILTEGVASETEDRVERASVTPPAVKTSQDQDRTAANAISGLETEESNGLHFQLVDNAYLTDKPVVTGANEDGGQYNQLKGPQGEGHTPATSARDFFGNTSFVPDDTEGVSAADESTNDAQALETHKGIVTPEALSKVAQQPHVLAEAVISAAESLPSKIANIFPGLQRAKRRAPSVISKEDASASTRVPRNEEGEYKQDLQLAESEERGGAQSLRTRSKELSGERAISSSSEILPKDTQAEFLGAAGAAVGAPSTISDSVSGEKLKSKKSKQQRKRRNKDTNAPKWAELEAEDDDFNDKAHGLPTATEPLETDTTISGAHEIAGEETREMEVKHNLTSPVNRDSAVRVSNSSLLEQNEVSQVVVRESGYHDPTLSPLVGQLNEEQIRTQADEDYATMTETSNSSADPLRISVEFDPRYQISIYRERPRLQPADLTNQQQPSHDKWPAQVSTPAVEGADLPQPPLTPARSVEDLGAPSPVVSTTKDRTSHLIQSSPSTREVPDTFAYGQYVKEDVESEATTGLQGHSDDHFSHAAGLSGALPPAPTSIRPARANRSRGDEGHQIGQDHRPHQPSDAQTQFESPSMVPESSVEHDFMDSQTKRSRSISEVTSPEPPDRGLKAARRVLSPNQSFRNRVESGAAASPRPRRYDGEESMHAPTVDYDAMVTSPHAGEAYLSAGIDSRVGFDTPTLRRSDQRSVSSHSVRSTGNVSFYSVGEPFRPLSGHSNRSGTPPLRRVSRNVSGDLRATSRLQDARAASSAGRELDLQTASSTDNPLKPHGKDHTEDMVNFYEGWAGVQGPPLSPPRDRPPSAGKPQSMQSLDLQSHLDQLTVEKRLLQEAKAQAERNTSEANYQCEVDAQALAEAGKIVEAGDRELRVKDEEIANVKENLRALQEELARLREVNEGLTTANKHLSADTDERYATLQRESAAVHQQWQQCARELNALENEHRQLATGMEEIVRQEIASALEDKNLEVQRLRPELDRTREKVRALQQQILASKAKDDYLVARDEDYFDSACQQLCQHVQQWVLRFSKVSDNKMCRLTSQLKDDKIEARLEDAILDGSDVDTYLADRIQRRDVFMSVVMKMIWEYIFTRYLFGMDRDQRHKLKMLEKTLSEVGPPRAVAHWRATTLTLLSRRPQFLTHRAQDTEAVAQEIYTTLSTLLPPPPALSSQIMESLRNLLKIAVTLSIEMRTQRAEYIMLPPLQPEYDPNTGMLTRKVFFNASLMNERSGDPSVTTNEDLERRGAVLRLVLFPLVVKKGDDLGEGDEEIVVAPAQVLIARPTKDRKVVRVMSGALEIERPRSIGTEMSGLESGMI